MFHNLQNYDSHISFQETGKYSFKRNIIRKPIEKYTSFNIQQSKEEGIKPGLPLIFIDSIS